MVLSMCNSNLSFIFEILKYLFKLVKYIIPTVLIVMATIDIVKIALNPDDKAKHETSSRIVKRIIYALLFFFISVFVSLIFRVVADNNPNDYGGGKSYSDSWRDCIAEILS